MEKRDLIAKPKKVVAKFTDKYGDERIIHKGKKGSKMSVFQGGNTTILILNRATAILIGQKISEKRKKCGLTLEQLCIKSGFKNSHPKEYMWAIENAMRESGVRMGTLYAIAWALNCEVNELMPSLTEVIEYSEIKEVEEIKLKAI